MGRIAPALLPAPRPGPRPMQRTAAFQTCFSTPLPACVQDSASRCRPRGRHRQSSYYEIAIRLVESAALLGECGQAAEVDPAVGGAGVTRLDQPALIGAQDCRAKA